MDKFISLISPNDPYMTFVIYMLLCISWGIVTESIKDWRKPHPDEMFRQAGYEKRSELYIDGEFIKAVYHNIINSEEFQILTIEQDAEDSDIYYIKCQRGLMVDGERLIDGSRKTNGIMLDSRIAGIASTKVYISRKKGLFKRWKEKKKYEC